MSAVEILIKHTVHDVCLFSSSMGPKRLRPHPESATFSCKSWNNHRVQRFRKTRNYVKMKKKYFRFCAISRSGIKFKQAVSVKAKHLDVFPFLKRGLGRDTWQPSVLLLILTLSLHFFLWQILYLKLKFLLYLLVNKAWFIDLLMVWSLFVGMIVLWKKKKLIQFPQSILECYVLPP